MWVDGFESGDEVTVQAGDQGIRFLLISGKPIEEPVAWYGPIAMNTNAELQQAVAELRTGTFIKHKRERRLPLTPRRGPERGRDRVRAASARRAP